MRTVLQGTPTRYRRLRAGDLPADRDLRQSYWRYVDFASYDLSPYDLTDTDILDCKGAGSILPDGDRTDWLISRRTDWTGAVIPADVSSYNHDFVNEVTKQRIPSLTGTSLSIAQGAVAQFARDGYWISWRNLYHEAMTRLGITAREAYTATRDVFAGRPRMLARLMEQMTSRITSLSPGDGITTATPVKVKLADGTEPTRFDLFLTNATDRYLVARAIEQAYLTNRGVEVVAHVGQLEPWPAVQVVARTRAIGETWFAGSWPA